MRDYLILGLSLIFFILPKKIVYLILPILLIDIVLLINKGKKQNRSNKGKQKNYYYEYLFKLLVNEKSIKYFLFFFILSQSITVIQQVSLFKYLNTIMQNSIYKVILIISILLLDISFGTHSWIYNIFGIKYYLKKKKILFHNEIINKFESMDPRAVNNFFSGNILNLFDYVNKTTSIFYDACRFLDEDLTNLFTKYIGIIIFSPTLFIQTIMSFYIIWKYILSNFFINIKRGNRNFSLTRNNLIKKSSNVFADIDTFFYLKEKNVESNHKNTLIDIGAETDLIDLETDKNKNNIPNVIVMWRNISFMIVFYIVWKNLNLNASTVHKVAMLALITIGLDNFYKVGLYNGEVLMHFMNLERSVNELNPLIESINRKIKEIDPFVDQFNKYILLQSNTLPNKGSTLFLFDKKIVSNILYISGPSGCGKSTFLYAILNKKQIYKSATVFKQTNKIDIKNKTPLEIVYGYNEIKNEEYAIECLKNAENILPINEIMQKPSGGETQRILIAKTLYKCCVYKVDFIILDEPDNNLDLNTFQIIMNNIIEKYKSQKIIFTTHKPHALVNIKNLEELELLNLIKSKKN
jgi:ABC-type lipoprotein export system ATPase subunit